MRQHEAQIRRVHQRDWEHVDNTIAYLKGRAKDEKPFIIHCSISCPHPAFESSRYYLDRIDKSKVTLPPFEEHLHPVMEYMSETKACLDRFTDEEILAAYHLVAREEGVFVEPASAASVAGLLKSAQDGWVKPGSTVVCTVTGHGLKDPDTALRDMPSVTPVPVDPGAVMAALGLG